MRSVTGAVLIACVLGGLAKELAANDLKDAQDSIDKLVDKFFSRVLMVAAGQVALHSADLDSTTLKKPGHLATPCCGYLRFLPNNVGVAQRSHFLAPRAWLPSPVTFRPMHPRVAVAAASDPFTVLGVPRTATKAEIKKAYRRKAIKMHPDKDKTPGASERFRELKDAYQLLYERAGETQASSGASSPGYDAYQPYSGSSWPSSTGYRAPSPPQDEYSFEDFFRDVSKDWEDLQQRSRAKRGEKPKSLWEELEDIGEEFLDFLEGSGESSESDRGYDFWEAEVKGGRSGAEEYRQATGGAQGGAAQAQRDAASAREAAQREAARAREEVAKAARDAAKAKENAEREIEDELAALKRKMGM